jgi:hypothetical protein
MSTLSTFLKDSLKENKILRWPDKLMPLKIYVAPFRWYQKSKQNESFIYEHMVSEALNLWTQATNGVFTFNITRDYLNSNVNILWRRANRRSLGLCTINGVKDHMIYSAEVEIGISDGIIHSAYQDLNEVKHTIIHEMGHVIGLPHSPYQEDIMYVPHQYGIVNLSHRDINSARWLYMMDPGFDPAPYMKEWGLESHCSIDELIWVYENQDIVKAKQQQKKEELTEAPQQHQQQPGSYIMHEQDILAYKNLYQLSLQHIKVDKKSLSKKNFKKSHDLFNTEK